MERSVTDKAGVWLRVSDPGQHADNQLPDLQTWASRRNLEIVQVYELGVGLAGRPPKDVDSGLPGCPAG